MASVVVLVSGNGSGDMSLRVSEDVQQVFEAYTEASGRPFALTEENGGGRLYVNPTNVAYWREAGEFGFH